MTNNINYDSEQISKLFIQHFYTLWIDNPQTLINTVITEKTKFKYNNNMYEYINIILLLNQLKLLGLEISILKYEIIDSKSRQIYILVKGTIKNSQSINNFSQSFLLINNKKNNPWNLINSILIID